MPHKKAASRDHNTSYIQHTVVVSKNRNSKASARVLDTVCQYSWSHRMM